jgi:hypothetical protein
MGVGGAYLYNIVREVGCAFIYNIVREDIERYRERGLPSLCYKYCGLLYLTHIKKYMCIYCDILGFLGGVACEVPLT